MTVSPTRGPATASSTEAVAGLHLAVGREREVEHDLLVLGDALRRHGLDVTWLTTHRTVTESGASCSGAVTASTDADLLAGYLHVVGRENAGAVGGFTLGGSDTSDDDLRATAAAAARRERREGRAVWFPGHDTVGAETTVGELLAHTAIEQVQVLGSGAAAAEMVVHTRGFLRPRFVGGSLVLPAQPARGGVLVPFETPAPTPCCVDHV